MQIKNIILALNVLVLMAFLVGFSWETNIPTSMTAETIGAESSASCVVVLGGETITGEVKGIPISTRGDLVSGDATVTETDTTGLEAGFTVSGDGVPASTTVSSITNATEFELSANATATAKNVDLTVHGVSRSRTGDTTSGDETITGSNTFGLGTGWYVEGTGIPDDTTIATITSGTAFELSQKATADGSSVALTIIEARGDTVTDTVTAAVFPGMTGGGGTVETVDSATQITFESTIAKTGTEQDIDLLNGFDSILVSVKLVGEAAADTATINYYASSTDDANNFSTTAFNTESVTGMAGATKILTYRFSNYICPRAKIVIANTTTESGSTDDIVATVVFAGYNE